MIYDFLGCLYETTYQQAREKERRACDGKREKPMKSMARRRLGSVPGCLYLRACDIGQAILEDGRPVTITWGANITGPEMFSDSPFKPELVQVADVWEGDKRRDNYEMLVPPEIAEKILPTLVK